MNQGSKPTAEMFLKQWAQICDPYPAGISPVSTDRLELDGLGFFPAGSGRYASPGTVASRDLPVGGVFILGNNFGSRAYLDRLNRMMLPAECEQGDTWGPLIDHLRMAHVDLDSCFFTNSYLGYLPGSSNLTKFPNDPLFSSRCAAFLKWELEQLKPRVVIALGNSARYLLAHHEIGLGLLPWNERAKKSFGKLDEANEGLLMSSMEQRALPLVAWVHPSAQDRKPKKGSPSYLESRFYILRGQKHSGRDAEIQMLCHALAT